MSALTWKRGEFEIATIYRVLLPCTGYVSACGTWGINSTPRGVYTLTYLLTGRCVTNLLFRLRDAKQLAEILTPIVHAVQLPELSDSAEINDIMCDAVRPTMLEWKERLCSQCMSFVNDMAWHAGKCERCGRALPDRGAK